MRRLAAFLLGNWPLKVAALGLAVVLYGGVVLSENTRSWPGQVPIEVLDPPAGGSLLDLPGSVSAIKYRAPIDVASQLTNGSFRAAIDLSRVEPGTGGASVEVPVVLVAVDARVQIVDYSPKAVNVRVDRVVSRRLPVTVDRGTVPEGLTLSPSQVDPASVNVRGASSRVASVTAVVARVAIDDSGLNVDREVDVEALDQTGNPVAGVEIDPLRVRVAIAVARELANATLPVVPTFTGTPAAETQVTAVTVDPLTVTVSGPAPAVGRLGSLPTSAIDIGGRDASFTAEATLAVPEGITVIGPSTVTVTVTIVRVEASRTFEVGIVLQGARPDRTYDLSAPSVLATLSGPAALLDGVDVSGLRARVPVGGASPGRHLVEVALTPPDGLTLVSLAPTEINVRVAVATPAPPPTPTPAPIPSPTTAASAQPVATTVPPSSPAVVASSTLHPGAP